MTDTIHPNTAKLAQAVYDKLFRDGVPASVEFILEIGSNLGGRLELGLALEALKRFPQNRHLELLERSMPIRLTPTMGVIL